jgi:hypothetical protein
MPVSHHHLDTTHRLCSATLRKHTQILGFPIQLLGLLMLPYLGVRWFVDGESAGKDIEAATVRGCV